MTNQYDDDCDDDDVCTPEVIDQAVQGRDLAYEVGKYTRELVRWELDGDQFREAMTLREGEWPGFVREVFGRMKGTMCDRMESAAPNADWASTVHEVADTLPEWANVLTAADGDTTLSAVGAAAIARVVANHMEEKPEPADDVQSLALTVRELELAGIPADDADLVEMRQRVAVAIVQNATLDAGLRGDKVAARQMVRAACSAALEEMNEMRSAMWGAGLGGAETPAEVRTMARAIADNPSLRRIAKLAGRMRSTLTDAKPAMTQGDGRDETVGVRQGRDIGQALPAERALFRHPTLKKLQVAKMADARLMQNKQVGLMRVAKAAEGPLVFVVDESYSMNAQVGSFSLNEMAKAAMLNMMRECNETKRPMAVVHFSGHSVLDVIGGRVSADALIGHATSFLGGGTAFVPAMGCALKALTSYPALGTADVVFISDARAGEFERDEVALNKAFSDVRETGARVWGVLVGDAKDSIAKLEPMCDSVVHIPKADDNSADELVLHIGSVMFGGEK